MFLNFKTFWKWWSHSCSSILQNKKKSQGIKSGKWGGCRTTATFITAGNCYSIWLSLSNLCTNFTDICHTPKPSTRICWHISHKRPNLAGNSKMVLSRVSFKDFVNILHIFVCVTCGRMTWMLTIFKQNSPMSEFRPTFKSPSSHHSIVIKSYCEYFVKFGFSFPKSKAKLNANALFLHNTTANYT